MIPVSLKLSNFTSYSENPPELDFTKFKLAAISGLNGAGKSSLLDAITWCIWGSSRAGDSSDSLIHSGADNMSVEFKFELDGQIFTIKRARLKKRGGSTVLEFWGNSHNLTEGTIKTTQEKIISCLHLSFETFTNSSYLRQGHADEFTTKGPTDRKRILADILGLDHYDRLEEKAKEKTKELQSKLTLLDYQLIEIEAELSQKDQREKELSEAQQKVTLTTNQINALEEEIKILQKEKETVTLALQEKTKLEQNLKIQQDELEQILRNGKERAERIKSLESRVKSQENLENKINQLKSGQKKLEELKQQVQKRLEIEKDLNEIQGKLNLKLQEKKQIETEIEKLDLQLKNLSKEGAKCPTCGQEVGKDQKHDVNSKLKSQKSKLQQQLLEIQTKKEETEIKNLEVKLLSLKIDYSELNNLEKSLLELEDLQRQKEQHLQDDASLQTEKKTVEELRSLYKQKALQVKTLDTEFAKLPKLSSGSSEVLLKLSGKESSLQTLRGEESVARGLLGRATELLSRSEQLEKLSKQKAQEKFELQKEKEIFEELSLAFGKKGIQAMIIEAAIPEIEDETNRLLEKLTEGRMKVAVLTQRETKTKQADGEKGLVETLDIIISDEMGERLYEMYSGGEAFRVNFCIRLAISKLLTHRAGAKLQFLVIDEGFGSQDAPGRARLIEAIDAIKNDFEKILVITHIEELKEEFPVRIEVSKNTTGSTFEVVGL